MSDYHEYPCQWQGINITVRHCTRWLYGDGLVQHIEVLSDDRVPLPITETGFKSHFMCGRDALAEFSGDPVAYVTAWLDHTALAKGWQAQRQLSLF